MLDIDSLRLVSLPDPLQTLRRRNHPLANGLLFAGVAWWNIAAIVLALRSPIRETTAWVEATSASITLGAAVTGAWKRRIEDNAPPRQYWWLFIPMIGWAVAVFSAPALGYRVQPPTDVYTVAALWYQVTASVGTGYLVLWLHRKRLRDAQTCYPRKWRRYRVTKPPTPPPIA
jgi:hypothetical protein